MQTLATLAANTLKNLLSGENGIAAFAAQIASGDPSAGIVASSIAVTASSLPADLAERSPVKYPSVQVFCEKLSNTQREKFRSFSGKAHLVVEVRASSDQVPAAEQDLQLYTQSVLQVLQSNRGDWGAGMFYGGTFDVTFAPVRRGGTNFFQSARVSLAVDVFSD